MIKSCREIQEEIDELKRKLQQDKMINRSMKYFSESRKCASNNADVICNNCNCWKNAREYSS